MNPGRWIQAHLRPARRAGVIAAGYQADLLLVADNPLKDLASLKDVRGLVLRGEWIDGEELMARLAAQVEGYSEAWSQRTQLRAYLEAGDHRGARKLLTDPTSDLHGYYLGEAP